MKFTNLSVAKKIVLLGYGKEGHSSHEFLQKYFPEKICEIRENITGKISAENGTAYIISPGIDRRNICQDIPAAQQTSNTELFFENLSESSWKKTIGISGSKGKSTTTKFMAEFLRHSRNSCEIGGNYGNPLLSIPNLTLTLNPELHFSADFLVVELSSFQLEYLQISPRWAIFLNCFGDHLDRHGDLTGYVQAKQKLWNGANKSADFLITDEQTFGNLQKNKAAPENIFLSSPVPENIFPVDSLFRSEYLRNNFGMVFTLGKKLKALGFLKKSAEKSLERTARTFIGLPHRLEFVREVRGVRFYNDSVATNPTATLRAVESFGKGLGVIILGGQTFHSDFATLLQKLLADTDAKLIIPNSEISAEILETLRQFSFADGRVISGMNWPETATAALKHCPSGKSVLLSPAAKSFDAFQNVYDRGDQWKGWVNEI